MSDAPRGELPDRKAAIESPRHVRPFTAAQRRALVLALGAFILCLAVALIRNPTHLTDPLPEAGSRQGELVDRLDPNTADVASLGALPSFGAKRAQELVAYREKIRAADPTRIVFTKLDDLMRVNGIGYAITRQIEPYLTFPETPTTSP